MHQFHDILPGSSIHSVYEAAHQQLTAALAEATKLREDSLRLSEPLADAANLSDVAKRGDGAKSEGGDGAKSAGYAVWNLQLRDRPFFAELTGAGDKAPWSTRIQARP